jgi:glycosyltransferase involved in cell wall biosynthesis
MISTTASPPQQLDPVCTIIIATLARRERAATLDRAISSIRNGNHSAINVVVVVNGNQFDRKTVAQLLQRRDLRVVQIATPSLTAAILAGRQVVDTPFFGFLDDDDEYLPGTVDARVTALSAAPNASLVACNGYRCRAGQDRIAMHHLAEAPVDPLLAIFKENWLASCGGLFRTKDLPVEVFVDIARYLEWTWLAFQIASAGHRIITIDHPGFRIHDTEGSESKSELSLLSQTRVFAQLLRTSSRSDISGILKSRICRAWHDVSNHYLRKGENRLAWKAHLCSLRHISGWRFFSYTRHLLIHPMTRNR